MPRGYPDFYSGVVPTMAVYGAGQINWYVAEDGDIDGESYADLAEYTVPTGYELHLMGGAIGSNSPRIYRFSALLQSVPLGVGHINGMGQLPFHPAAAFVIPPLYTVALRIYNDDDISRYFSSLSIGFLVKVET